MNNNNHQSHQVRAMREVVSFSGVCLSREEAELRLMMVRAELAWAESDVVLSLKVVEAKEVLADWLEQNGEDGAAAYFRLHAASLFRSVVSGGHLRVASLRTSVEELERAVEELERAL